MENPSVPRSRGEVTSEKTERFEHLRPALVRHAYRMLGQYVDAEDIVQDAFLRWNDALRNSAIEDDRAFLRTTVTRLCLDRLRSARAKREVYAGPWLPEPVLSDDPNDPQSAVTLADDISFALLLALERLAPLERAAFLLHDVLVVPFAEIAQTLDRSEPAVRKLASRAREHVRIEGRHSSTSREQADGLRRALLAAIRNDDAAALEELLTREVVFTGDGAGELPWALVPVVGRERVSRLLLDLQREGGAMVRQIDLVTLNGLPGFALFTDEGLELTIGLEIDAARIAAMYCVHNPEKLRAISAQLVGSGDTKRELHREYQHE
jgi:RNA polymerase sigma-70 factor, ECF subfamily